MKMHEKIKEARKAAGLTQRQIADKIGMDYRNYQKYEYGVCNNPSLKTLLKIARVCNVTIESFVED